MINPFTAIVLIAGLTVGVAQGRAPEQVPMGLAMTGITYELSGDARITAMEFDAPGLDPELQVTLSPGGPVYDCAAVDLGSFRCIPTTTAEAAGGVTRIDVYSAGKQ